MRPVETGRMMYNTKMVNFHVMIVHFPIALLTLYAIMEIISIKKLSALPYWFYLKAILVILGVLGAVAAQLAGGLIEDKFGYVRDVVEMHALFAAITTSLFFIISLAYLLVWFKKEGGFELHKFFAENALGRMLKSASVISEKCINSPLIKLAALVGLITLTVTAALGGAIAFGSSVDPIASFIFNLFSFKESI